MTEHGVEKGLRQRNAVRFAAQPLDHQGGMQGQRIEAPVECIGNAAAFKKLGGSGALGRPRIDDGGELPFKTAATKQVDLLNS